MDKNKKIVILSFVIAALLAWFITSSMAERVMQLSKLTDPLWNTFMPVSRLVGLMVGGGLLAYLLKSAKTNEYATEVVAELKKVTWPGFDSVRLATIVVIVVTAIITLILGMFDWIWGGVTSFIYKA